MATNAQRIVVPGIFHAYAAPVGTAAPTDVTTDVGTEWTDLGITGREGTAMTISGEFTEIRGHQSVYPFRVFRSSATGTLAATLLEWSALNFQVVFGGGEVTEVPTDSGVFKYSPQKGLTVPERALVWHMEDGDKHFRIVVPRALNSADEIEVPINPDSETGVSLPMELSILGSDTADAWYLLTDDPAFTPAGSGT